MSGYNDPARRTAFDEEDQDPRPTFNDPMRADLWDDGEAERGERREPPAVALGRLSRRPEPTDGATSGLPEGAEDSDPHTVGG